MKKYGFRILIVLLLVFIFSNSFAGQAESARSSARVLQLVEPLLELLVGKGNVTQHLVRKLAHFVEFGALGLLLGLHYKKPTSTTFLFALLVAMIDETIQIFTGRGSQIRDVWLDFAGAVTGMAAAVMLLWLLSALRQRKTKKRKRSA